MNSLDLLVIATKERQCYFWPPRDTYVELASLVPKYTAVVHWTSAPTYSASDNSPVHQAKQRAEATYTMHKSCISSLLRLRRHLNLTQQYPATPPNYSHWTLQWTHGLICCDGRLWYAKYLAWDTRYLIILPKDHQVTSLVIKGAHERNHRAGTNYILTDLSTCFWIISES